MSAALDELQLDFGGEVIEPGRVTIGDAVEVVELSLLDQSSSP